MWRLTALAAIVSIGVAEFGYADDSDRATQRPNILFAFADDWGRMASAYAEGDGVGTINDVVRTPNFDAIAKRGVLFNHAYVNAPSCTPCRSSLLSGQYFWRTGRGAILQGAVWDSTIPAWPLLLRESGYHIGQSWKVWTPGRPADAPFGARRFEFERRGGAINRFSQTLERASQDADDSNAIDDAKKRLLQTVRQNFVEFLDASATDAPFCYWFGPTNVHRKWIAGSGLKHWGIDPDELSGKLPPFLPDVPVVRQDVADYLGEIAAFDAMLGVLVEVLAERSLDENTLIVVSGDHGPPGFPHGKCNLYDFGTRVPLVVSGPGVTSGRVVDDLVSLPDLAATFLEAGQVAVPNVMTSRSIWPTLRSTAEGRVDPTRKHVLIGRERHVARARVGQLPYPQRAIRTHDYLLIRNFKPDRFPLGDPYQLDGDDPPSREALTENTFVTLPDEDAGPTKAFLVEHRDDAAWSGLFKQVYGKRPEFELFDLSNDPHQMNNLADDPKFGGIRAELTAKLMEALKTSKDPRVEGDGAYFETPPLSGPVEDVGEVKTPRRKRSEANDNSTSQYVTAGNPSATDRGGPEDQPLSPDASLQLAHVRKGFRLELVACEPQIQDPVAIDWGTDGTLWVVEMADYPSGMDGKGKSGGRVRRLIDRDGDGFFEDGTLFIDGLSFPNGVLAWKNGVLITAAPEILYAEDTDGDGRADRREVLLAGFLEGNQQLRVNGLRYGLDNWVHCAIGSHHAGYGAKQTITLRRSGEQVKVGSRDFRFRPFEARLDTLSGPSQYGRNRDDWGNWFGVQNSRPLWHYVLEDRYLKRNPYVAVPDARKQVVTPVNPRVYPAKTPQKRFHSFDQAGRFTSACSGMVYRDSWLFGPESGADDAGNVQHAFTCEPFHNVVQHNVIFRDGVSFGFHRDPAESDVDFFASADRWCRPVMARTGPDGALWVVDMYRYMIEHPQWLTDEGRSELRPNYRSGEHQGRIYRIVPEGVGQREVPSIQQMTHVELVAALSHPNGWVRDAAQLRLIEELGAPADRSADHTAAVDALLKLASTGARPLGRLHALATLDALGQTHESLLLRVLQDSHANVRRLGIRCVESVEIVSDALLSQLVSMVDDEDLQVRLQLACTLGQFDRVGDSSDEPKAANALARLIVENDSHFLRTAALSSVKVSNAAAVLLKLMEQPEAGLRDAVRALTKMLASTGQSQSLVAPTALVLQKFRESDSEQAACLGCLEATMDAIGLEALVRALPSAYANSLRQTVAHSITVLGDSDAPTEYRLACSRLLTYVDWDEGTRELVGRLVSPSTDLRLQLATLEALAGRSEVEIAPVLVGAWDRCGPATRRRVADLLLSRSPWRTKLIQSLKQGGAVQPDELTPTTRQRLLRFQDAKEDPELVSLLKLDSHGGDRSELVQRYSKEVADGVPVVSRGKKTFAERCAVCHRLGTIGKDVGPSLAALTNRTTEFLLTSILDPNAQVEAKYFRYLATTIDGRVASGMILSESAPSISLIDADGKQQTFLRTELDEFESTRESLMPTGMDTVIEPVAMRDLIAYLQSELGKDQASINGGAAAP